MHDYAWIMHAWIIHGSCMTNSVVVVYHYCRTEAQKEAVGRDLVEEFKSSIESVKSGTPKAAAPLVIIELKKTSNIESIDITPVSTTVSWTARLDYDDLWTQEGFSVANPEFTSGRVLLEEFLHGMIAFTLPISRFCMDTKIIDHFVDVSDEDLPVSLCV